MGLNDLAEGRFRRIEPGTAARRAEEERAADAVRGAMPAVRVQAGVGARRAEQERRECARPEHGLQLRAATGKPFTFPEGTPTSAGEALPILRTPVEGRQSSQPETATPALTAGKPDGASAQADRTAQVRQPENTSATATLSSPLSRFKALFGRRRQPLAPPVKN